jgi:hypothetical protein
MDLLGNGPPQIDRFVDILREVAAFEGTDGIVFLPETVTGIAIREEARYEGIRITLEGRLDVAKLRFRSISASAMRSLLLQPKRTTPRCWRIRSLRTVCSAISSVATAPTTAVVARWCPAKPARPVRRGVGGARMGGDPAKAIAETRSASAGHRRVPTWFHR